MKRILSRGGFGHVRQTSIDDALKQEPMNCACPDEPGTIDAGCKVHGVKSQNIPSMMDSDYLYGLSSCDESEIERDVLAHMDSVVKA